MKILALVTLFFPLFTGAQEPRTGPPRGRPTGGVPGTQETQAKAEEPAAVEGRVLNLSTGEPLKRAAVTLRRVSAPSDARGGVRGYTATTDQSGRFTMTGVAPGDYRLSARRNGFVDAEYGARDFLRAGSTLTLKPGQKVTDVLFQMTPHGVITGRVVDEDGEPAAGVRIQALRYRYPEGRKQMAEYGEGSTNDIGEYRVAGLPPGRYYISASPRRSFDRSLQAAGPQPEEEYAVTFFPGTSDAAAAAAVDLGPGSQLRGLDMTLRRHRTVYVRGRVAGGQSSGRQRVMVFLRPRAATAPSMNRPAGVDPNGNFEFRGVAPGSYTLVAALPERGRSALTAKLPLEVGNANLENLSLTLNPPVNVAGRVRADSQTTVDLAGIRVNLRAAEPMMFGSSSSARVKADGTFSFEGVSPDEYAITLSGLPDGFYVKVIAVDGQNVLLTGIDLDRGAAGGMEILLSPHAGLLTGVAQNDQQEAAPGATVVLIPEEKERRGLVQYYRTASTDAAGRFTVKNLDPGQYRVYAWPEIEPGAYFDPDFMRPLENAGQPVTIREDGQDDVKVRVIG